LSLSWILFRRPTEQLWHSDFSWLLSAGIPFEIMREKIIFVGCMKELFPDSQPMIISGPCSAESDGQVFATASALKEQGVGVFRAGIWKPRTHPGCFEGRGVEAIPWMKKVKDELRMKICTEVASREHVAACIEAGFDILWIGARTTANPFLVQEIAEAMRGTGVPVLIKNPINPDIELWAGAIERFRGQGIEDIGVIHRGFSSFEKTKYRNAPYWRHAIELRSRFPELPFFCDPSHMAGATEYIREISQRALDLGLDGLMIESHCEPSCALSDSAQQLTPHELGVLLNSLIVRTSCSDSQEFAVSDTLGTLRGHINSIDVELIRLLGERMSVSREIGRFKKQKNIAILQTSQWDRVLANASKAASDNSLDEDFVRKVFNLIHAASISEQDRILEGEERGTIENS